MIKNYFPEVVGQDPVKTELSMYVDNYKKTGTSPFVNLTAQKGGGKTFMMKQFRKKLVNPRGETPPLQEVNASSIKNVQQFFDHVYFKWVTLNSFLFLDEAHNLPQKVQEMLLTVLNTEKSPVRYYEFEGAKHLFDFSKISIGFATTDQQKLSDALKDRLTNISFTEYSEDELYKIFLIRLDESIKIIPSIQDDIKSSFRGNPRDADKKAEKLEIFCNATGNKVITKQVWDSFCKIVGIRPFGLNNAEMQILKILGEKRECSLTELKSVTGFSDGVIRKDYEITLLKKGLMRIGVASKRCITHKGKLALPKK